MKVLLCLTLMLAVARAYETQADNIDLDAIMANDDHHRALLHCVLEKITCMEITQHEIDILQEAIKTNCAKCKAHQKPRLNKFLKGIKAKFPEDYVVFKQKYDPENKYLDSFEKFISQFNS